MLTIDYETLVFDAPSEIARLLAFCELPWHDACLQPELGQRSVHTASVWQVRQPIHHAGVGRWRHYAPWLPAALKTLSDGESVRV